MKSLRTKLLISHLGSVGIMLAVMAWAVVNMSHLGGSIDRIVRNNYDSVVAAQHMDEALERQDSAATFFLAGQTQKARTQYAANRPVFEQWLNVERNNVTEPGEQRMADDLTDWYALYKTHVERLIFGTPMTTQAARAYYFSDLEPRFLQIKQRAQDVLIVNQNAIARASYRAKREARQATVTTLVTTLIAMSIAAYLAVRSFRSVVRPIESLASHVQQVGAGHLDSHVKIDRQDEIGELAGAFNVMSDNLREARRKSVERLRRAESLSDAALESLYDPVIVTDAQARIVRLNKAAESTFLVGNADNAQAAYEKLPASEVIHEPRILDAIDRAIHHEAVSAEEDSAGIIALQAPDSPRSFRLRANPMYKAATDGAEGELLGAVVVLEDITHLREVDRLKTEFISVAAHELRTPVTSLLMSVQLLREGAVGELTDDQRQVVEAQHEDLTRLLSTTQDLLDLTRLEAGMLPAYRLELPAGPIVLGAIETVQHAADQKGVTIVANLADTTFYGDSAKIGRVLTNLLENAVRHTPRGGSITVGLVRTADCGVTFQVSDTGVGISSEYQQKIFDPFSQVPGATGGGAGLGLSIVRALVAAHGGTITVESAPGHGSTFSVTLPPAPAGEAHG